MQANAFATLATLQLPSPCRLLFSACCPDKDLVVLLSRLGGRDKMSLWKMQGSKKWEVDIGSDNSSSTATTLAWSPSGQTIAVVHDSARITLHSVQDGRIERTLVVPLPFGSTKDAYGVVGIWWFAGYRTSPSGVIPDVFKRDGVKTGSALSILKILPLLDPLGETDENVTATDLFAFQGTQTKVNQQQFTPKVINQWPSLVPHPGDASICSSGSTDDMHSRACEAPSSAQSSEDDDSLLVLVDERGVLHSFLDGSYFLGSVHLTDGQTRLTCTGLFKHPSEPLFLLHPQNPSSDILSVGVQPVSVDIPLLGTAAVRDFARLSSAARELTWYIMHVLNEVRESWLGSETVTGARHIGIKWVYALEKRLHEQFGHFTEENPNIILDLTHLLVTGSATEGLMDFIMSSEQTSERNLQKWDSSVTDALTKMRNYTTTRVIPAFQRLHIIMDEIRGWSYIRPQFTLFALNTEDVISCLRLAERGIFISSWLASEARRELGTFKQFLSFIRHETAVANPSAESHPSTDYDIMEVNGYLMSGLMASQIDRWFTGPAPQLNPGDLSYSPPTPNSGKTLEEALQLAHAALQDPSQTTWQPNIPPVDFSHLDRNLEALVQELASRCQRVFARASQAAARSAIVSTDGGAIPTQVADASCASFDGACQFTRQRVVSDENEPGRNLHYLVVHINLEGRPLFCLSRMPYGRYTAGVHQHVEVTLLECSVCESDGTSVAVDILDAEFFDDETIIIVYQKTGTQGPIFVGTGHYTTLRYQTLESEGYVSGPARRDMMANALQRWNGGHLPWSRIPITRCRELSACRNGPVSLAVNGRVGRRVVCVLDGDGMEMEILDMEGEEEGEMEMEMVGSE
ncbi:anaphase-promoting complex, cyclosome, subunit 4-domain-containing protein [Phlebopus sp. FC_14]|nr:anaphase-promoting complex, cyclosome, subunit 4-domain-containing protein [Phlebopus sp. FC_14]